jgi:hypothetical protein
MLFTLLNGDYQRRRESDMDKPNGLDRKSLQTQLENYRLIVEVNTDSKDESIFAKEELAKKLELAQRCVNESYQWEELGDQTKSHDALSSASIVIVAVGAVIKRILCQDSFLDDNNLQSVQISPQCCAFC